MYRPSATSISRVARSKPALVFAGAEAIGVLIDKLAEHAILQWIIDRLATVFGESGALTSIVNHPFYAYAVLVLLWIMFVYFVAQKHPAEPIGVPEEGKHQQVDIRGEGNKAAQAGSVEAAPHSKVVMGNSITSATTYGDNSPAATVGSVEAGATVHIGNIVSTVGQPGLPPSVTQFPIIPMRGRYQKVSMQIGTVAVIERGRWGGDSFSIELKGITENKVPNQFSDKIELCAHIAIGIVRVLFFNGPEVRYLNPNEFGLFKLPPSSREAGMVYYANLVEQSVFGFMGVYVLHINAYAKTVDFGVITVDTTLPI